MTKQITRRPKEPYYKDAVQIWFDFYKEKFFEPPTFDTSAPRDLKLIMESLRKRAELQGKDWTLQLATERLKGFLNFAYSDKWISEHFTLRILNSQKDPIYARLRAATPIKIIREVSDCCKSDMIPPDLDAAENAGSLYRAHLCYICKKCGKVCEPINI